VVPSRGQQWQNDKKSKSTAGPMDLFVKYSETKLQRVAYYETKLQQETIISKKGSGYVSNVTF